MNKFQTFLRALPSKLRRLKRRRIVRNGKNNFEKNIRKLLSKQVLLPVVGLVGIIVGATLYIKYDPFKNADLYPKDDQALTAGTISVPAAADAASFVLSLEHETLSFNPDFTFAKTAFAQDNFVGSTATGESNGTAITAEIKNSSGQLAKNLSVSINSSSGNPEISINKVNESQFSPGEYRLFVTLSKNGKQKTITQNFAWGVLAINSLKSIYTPNEEAKFSFGVLNEKGETLCNSALSLEIETPTGEKSVLSTDNDSITKNKGCRGDSKISGPDYAAAYGVTSPGVYKLHLVAITANGKFFIDDELIVQETVPFVVERTEYPTRIYPAEPYDVSITVTANQDFSGKIVEAIPASFEIANTSAEVTTTFQGMKQLSWDTTLSEGETTQLTYTIKFPDISPEFYLVGPLTFTENNTETFKEARQWQIASDTVVVSGGITTSETQFGGMQRKIVYVNSNWYAFYNDGADIWYKKSSNGVSWGAAVDVDSSDADNYNPTVSVSGTIIDVFWIDDGSERIEGKRIDTASADSQGTLCTGPSEGTIGSTFLPSLAALSATEAVAGFTDSSSDGEFNFYEITGLDGTCSITDVQPGNIVLGTGISAGDRPVLVPLSSTKVALVFQDGNLSYSEYDTVENEWKTMELNIASVTDNNYSIVSNGAATPKTWFLTQDAGNTTDTNFYTLDAANTDFVETEMDNDVGAANQDGLQDIDMFCVAADDCKMVYVDNMDTTTPDIIFRDCNNASCSSSTAVTIDADCGTTNSQCNPKIHCSSATDCHIVYFEVATAPDIFFVDCDGADNTNACSTTAAVNTNADFGGGTSTTHLDIDCPTGDNCKFIYGDDNNGTVMFVDCADDQCAVATDVLTNITVTGYGTSVVGPKLALDCPTSTTCKIVVHDIDTGSIVFVDCSTTTTPETCAGNLAADTIQTSVGTTADRNAVDIDCAGDGTDCKIIYTNDTSNNLRFADCNDTDCDAATITTFDANGGTDSTTEPDVDIYCVSVTDCKFLYNGALTVDAEKLYFVDCDTAACTTGGVIDMPGPRFRGAVNCVGGTTDCKMVYYDGTTAAAPTVQFADCDRGNCYPTVTDDADPWTSETNVSGVSLTYDSSNSDLIASILMDASETAYYMTSDATTISWAGETAYDGFSAAGDMDNLSTPEKAAGTTPMGALARQGSNLEFDLLAVLAPIQTQNHFRFRDDTTALNTDGGWLAAEDTNYSELEVGDTYRLRFEVANGGAGTATNYDYRLEYAAKSGTCAASSFATVPVTASSEPFEMVLSSQYANLDAISASRLTATGSFVNGIAVEDSSNSTGNHTLVTGEYSELEYAFTANANAAPGTTYCFRLTNAGSTTNFTYSVYPEAAVTASGILLHWGLNEGTGSTTKNSVNTSYDGTITAGAWKTEPECIYSNCLLFNGTSSKVDTTTPLVAVKSVSFWAKPTSSTTTFLQISGSAYVSASNGTLSATGFTNPVFYVNGQRSKTITANQWNHIVVTTGTGIDTTTFTVGNNSSNYYSGHLDEVKLYNTAITAEEVRGLYTGRGATDPVSASFGNGSSTLFEGLVGYWKLDESSGNASDASGNQNTLTNTNTVAYSSGKYGRGADIEASSSQYLTVADNASLDVISDLSVSAWIKPESTTASTQFTIVSKPDSYLLTQYGDEVRLSLNSSSNYVETTDANLTTGVWYLVTAVYTAGQQNIKIFVNGVQKGTTSSGTIPASLTNSSTPFNVGGEVTSSNQTINLQVSTSANDAHEKDMSPLGKSPTSGGAVSISNTDTGDGCPSFTCITAGRGAGSIAWSLGARFTNVTIPQGSNIISASFTLTSTGSYTTANPIDYIVSLHDTDNAAQFTGVGNNDFTSGVRSRTTADSGAWDVNSVLADTEYSVDITSAVQEVVDRGGWSSGNALAVLVDTHTTTTSLDEWQSWYSYDRDTTKAPELSITYGSGVESNFYDGVIDEARVYKRALSSAEVSALYSLAPGPIAHWKMDENTGTTANDTSGNNYTGTLVSTPKWETGKYGSALSFDGSNNSRMYATNVIPTGDFTYTFWTYFKNSGSREESVLSAENSTAGSDTDELFMGLTGGTAFRLALNGAVVADWPDPAANTWYYYTVTRSSASVKLYQNGVLVATGTDGTALTFDAGCNLYLGVDPRTGCDESGNTYGANFNGFIDDLKIYDYARTQSQIVEDMNGGATLDQSLLSLWKLDENNGTTANDSTSNANNISLSAASWTTSGKFGSAWVGTGGTWLSMADVDAYDLAASDDVSISMWFKSSSGTNPDAAQYIYLLDKADVSSGGARGYIIYFNNLGQVVFGIDDDTNWGTTNVPTPDDTAASSTDVFDTNWHNLVAVKTGTSKIEMFIDGQLAGVDPSLTATGTLDNSFGLAIGGRDASNGNEEFIGTVDEIKFYAAALTPDQVKLEFNQDKAAVLGSTSTTSTGTTPDNSSAREYCVPGDTSTCNPPVAEWKMDENTGTTSVFDSSTNNLTLTMTAMEVDDWIPGILGSALQFDGAGTEYLTRADDANLDVSTTFTVSGWIKATDASGSRGFIQKHDENIANGWQLGLDSTGVMFWDLVTSGHQIITGLTSVNDGKWHHVVGTLNGTDQRLYIDGKLDDSRTLTGSISVNSLSLELGRRRSSGAGCCYLNGGIDNVRIYQYARTPAQVAWEYNQGAPTALYNFDECSGTTIYNAAEKRNGDAVGNNGSLTIGGSGSNTSVGECSSGTGTEAWNNGTTGKRNSSLNVDGTDDYVTVGTAASTRVTFPYTIAAWINLDTLPSGDEYYAIVSKYHAFTNDREYRFGISNTGDKIEFAKSSDGTSGNLLSAASNTSFASPDLGTWVHVAVTIDSSGFYTFYRNGIPDGSGTFANTTIHQDNTINTMIGAVSYSSTNPDLFFDGKIDDLRMYNYNLTPAQIKTVMNSGAVRFD